MKSKFNFIVIKNNEIFDMHELGLWVSDFYISSPNIERSKIHVNGMPGAHLGETNERERQVNIGFEFGVINMIAFDELKHKIYNLFFSKEEITVIRDLFPDKTMQLLQEGYYDIENITPEDGYFDLTLTMIDPYLYGPEKPYNIPDTATIENQGTAEAEPIFTLQAKEPTTFAMISNGEKYMMVGRPYDVSDDEPYQKYERIFYSDASSTVGWTNGTDVDGGVVAGTMQSNGTRLEASSYGSGTRWHGPAIKRSMPEVVSDFRFQAFVALFNQNVAAYVGRIEIYLLDTVGNTVAKLAIKDTQSAQSLGFAEIRAGDMNNNHFLINEYGDRPGNWNNFNGILRVEREGNEWYAYVAMVDTTTGRHHTRRSVRWIDTNNRFTRNVAQVQVHVGQFGSHQTTAGGVYSMTLEKINQETNGVPYIADAGDEIVFDHVTGDAYINGESVPFDMGADFFKLAKGGNGLGVLPENTFETNVKFRERYR